MSFAAILIALLLEQARPLAPGNGVHLGMRAWVRGAVKYLDAGDRHHAWLTWGVAVGLPSAISFAMYWWLNSQVGWLAGILWSVAVLYATLGFRQFSHHFTAIRDALESGDEQQARTLLAHWKQIDVASLPRSEIIRHVIEHSILAAHRHVFGVLGWFSVLAMLGLGPLGAVLYRLAEFVPRYWANQHQRHLTPISAKLITFSNQAWYCIDWVPARMTAIGFAIVGSFEEAIDAWRAYLQREGDAVQNDSVIIAASSGAVNLRLGGEPVQSEEAMAAASAPRQEPGQGHLRSIVGLVWRSVVLWMVLLALLTLARLLG